MVSNPFPVALTSYFPGESEMNEYNPAAVVTVESVSPVAVFFAVTVAPGTIAPLVSATCPLMPPRPAWENSISAQGKRSAMQRKMCGKKVAPNFCVFICGLLDYIDSNV